MRFAKGFETWIKNRLPNSLRDRFNNNKYRYIIRKEKPLDLISKFDFLKCEVSKVEMYKGGTKFKDLDNFLKNNQFKLSSHPYWRVPDHGDVLYSKNKV